MTSLSLFMTSTGVFCFVPISQRLAESGIIPATNSWWSRGIPPVLAPIPYAPEEKLGALYSADKDTWSEAEAPRHQTQSPLEIPLHAADDTLVTDQQLAAPCASEWSTGIFSPCECSPINSVLPSPHTDGFDERASVCSISDSVLCDSCNTLLQGEIPPDHIPSVIRAFSLLEAQDRLYDVAFNECEVVALTNAFSMLQL